MYRLFKYPEDEAFLRKKALKVNVIDSIIRQTLDDMLKIMYQEKGVGLAAPQIGISKRLVVVDLGFSGCPYKMVNPYIIERSEETIEVIEGCLSVPERVGPVKRSKSITVKYLNEHGQKKIIQAEELLAVCIQHEIDHLNGVLFVDNVEQFEKLTSSGLPL